MLSEPSEGAASLAAIELGVDDERRCPRCGAGGAVKRGKARGLRRFQCKECGRTFGALTGTSLSGLHHKERWLAFDASLAEGETIKASAARCGIAPSTAHRWRHRFLAAVRQAPDRLAGSNPCLGIAKNPRNNIARFLDADELARLGRALDAHEARWPEAVTATRMPTQRGARPAQA